MTRVQLDSVVMNYEPHWPALPSSCIRKIDSLLTLSPCNPTIWLVVPVPILHTCTSDPTLVCISKERHVFHDTASFTSCIHIRHRRVDAYGSVNLCTAVSRHDSR